MAISKSVLMRNGVTATYWKITSLNIDIQGLRSSFVVSPFLDETNATARSRPVGPSKVFHLPIVEATLFSRTLNDVYTAIITISNTDVPNLNGIGTHKFDADLAEGEIV